jgi:hypothetical protein
MSKPGRIHADAGREQDNLGHRTRCGRPFMPADRVTLEAGAITCRGCARLVSADPVPPVVEPETPFEPSGPYAAPRATTTLDARAAREVLRSLAGEAPDPARRTLDGALRRWFAHRLASMLRPAPVIEGERDRAPVDDDRARMPSSDRGVIEAHASVHWTDRAIDAACAEGVAFAGGADGAGALTLDAPALRRLVILYVEDRKSAREIGDLIAAHAGLDIDAITDRQVGLAWRTLRKRMQGWLEVRGLVDPLARAREIPYSAGPGQASEGDMAAGYEIEGWKDIATACGCSVSRLQRLMGTSDAPPVHRDHLRGVVVAKRSDLESWRARQVKPKDAA